jgi:hypothetical protein
MGTLRPNSVAVHEEKDGKVAAEHHQELDAGALFVLKSRGDDEYFSLHVFFFFSFLFFIFF